MNVSLAAGTVCAVSLVAFTVYGVRLPPGRAVALGSALLVGCIPFALLGIAFGYWLSPRAALPVANLLYLPLAIGGFLWTRPTEAVPHGVDVSSQLLPTRNWMEVLDAVADYLAAQTAGQCGPCVHGLPTLANAIHARLDPAPLAAQVSGRGVCAHPTAATAALLSGVSAVRGLTSLAAP